MGEVLGVSAPVPVLRVGAPAILEPRDVSGRGSPQVSGVALERMGLVCSACSLSVHSVEFFSTVYTYAVVRHSQLSYTLTPLGVYSGLLGVLVTLGVDAIL